jgi:hypothetical protein
LLIEILDILSKLFDINALLNNNAFISVFLPLEYFKLGFNTTIFGILLLSCLSFDPLPNNLLLKGNVFYFEQVEVVL